MKRAVLVPVLLIVLGAACSTQAPGGDSGGPGEPIGTTPGPRDGMKAQTEANARAVREAVKTGKFPERLSALVKPKPFDREAFDRDPQGYLDVVEPGRVFQTVRGGPGVKTLDVVGSGRIEVDQEGSVTLRVRGEALAPVTFTSFHSGAFENGLTSITVRADGAGAAFVTYTATVGVIADVHIAAGSPMAAGQARFVVAVRPK